MKNIPTSWAQFRLAGTIYVFMLEEELLCVRVMLPFHYRPLPYFPSCGLSFIFDKGHCWNLLSSEGLHFLSWWSEEYLNTTTTLQKLQDATFKMRYKKVSSYHSCNQFWKCFMYSFVLLIGAPKKLCRLNKLKFVCQSFETISTVWSNCCGLNWTR